MLGRFDVTFPLVLNWEGGFSITFTAERDDQVVFTGGMIYLDGDNGSGKTTFINMLSLTAGRIGKATGADANAAAYNGQAYNAADFDPYKAADIRETHFCIYPQKAFFLPVSTRDNYLMLKGTDSKKASTFSDRQYPDLLSGGQQQQLLMDIVLDEQKPVWFLDEPLTNLDAERRHYFWQTLQRGFDNRLRTAFFIDHWLGHDIREDGGFKHVNTLHVAMENAQGGEQSAHRAHKQIALYVNPSPRDFLDRQIRKTLNKADGRLSPATQE